MEGEWFWNTMASVAILFAAGLFVTMTSVAALNAASFSAGGGVTCNQYNCVSLASNY